MSRLTHHHSSSQLNLHHRRWQNNIVAPKREFHARQTIRALQLRTLFLGSSGLSQVLESLAALELGVLDDTYVCVSKGAWGVWMGSRTRVSIAGEVAGPCDEGLALVLAGGDGESADGRHGGRVGQLGLRRDDAVCDEVVDAL